MLREFHHAVLHDVQSRFAITHVINAALEGPFFNAFKEVRKFLFCCQRYGVPGCPALSLLFIAYVVRLGLAIEPVA
jgi:hypothetical protein